MRPKIFNRVLMALLMIYIPIAELGATGSYKRMLGAFAVLAVMAWLGWMEHGNTKVGAGDTVNTKTSSN